MTVCFLARPEYESQLEAEGRFIGRGGRGGTCTFFAPGTC